MAVVQVRLLIGPVVAGVWKSDDKEVKLHCAAVVGRNYETSQLEEKVTARQEARSSHDVVDVVERLDGVIRDIYYHNNRSHCKSKTTIYNPRSDSPVQHKAGTQEDKVRSQKANHAYRDGR